MFHSLLTLIVAFLCLFLSYFAFVGSLEEDPEKITMETTSSSVSAHTPDVNTEIESPAAASWETPGKEATNPVRIDF